MKDFNPEFKKIPVVFDGIRAAVICNDGFTVSIQASRYHYCSPKADVDYYEDFELGFPSEKDDIIFEFAEDTSNPTGTVYGYVPSSLVMRLVEKHGGIISYRSLQNA